MSAAKGVRGESGRLGVVTAKERARVTRWTGATQSWSACVKRGRKIGDDGRSMAASGLGFDGACGPPSACRCDSRQREARLPHSGGQVPQCFASSRYQSTNDRRQQQQDTRADGAPALHTANMLDPGCEADSGHPRHPPIACVPLTYSTHDFIFTASHSAVPA